MRDNSLQTNTVMLDQDVDDVSLPTISASDVAAILSVIGKTSVLSSGAIGVGVIMWYIWSETGNVPYNLDIPKEDIGTPNNPSALATTTGPVYPTGSNSVRIQQ